MATPRTRSGRRNCIRGYAGWIRGRLSVARKVEHMATRDYEGGVVLSLLDRLIDLEPGSGQEARANSWEELRQHKESLCRDLTALLNTRRAEADFPPDYEEADRSLLTFGITDFTA